MLDFSSFVVIWQILFVVFVTAFVIGLVKALITIQRNRHARSHGISRNGVSDENIHRDMEAATRRTVRQMSEQASMFNQLQMQNQQQTMLHIIHERHDP